MSNFLHWLSVVSPTTIAGFSVMIVSLLTVVKSTPAVLWSLLVRPNSSPSFPP